MQLENVVLCKKNDLGTHRLFEEMLGSPLKGTTHTLLALQWKIIHFYEEK